MSPERLALIEAFKKHSEGLEKKFEARTLKRDWEIISIAYFGLKRPAAYPWLCIFMEAGGWAATI